MAKGYVPVFFDWLDTTQDLSAEEKGNLIDAVVSYAAGLEYEHMLNGATKIAFRFLKGQVDRNTAIANVRRQAREGKTNNNKQEQSASKEINNKNNNNKNNNKNNNQNKSCDPPRRFTPPTVEEVKAYCRERNNNIDPEYFVDFYTARGWVLSNGKQIKDWRACVRTWEKRDYNKAKVNPAANFTQRDYSGVEAEQLDSLAAEMRAYKAGYEAKKAGVSD